MKYFKVFNTENEYLEYIHSEECISPYVITLRDSSNTWISADIHDYSKDYFTIESLEDNNEIKFTSYRSGSQCQQFDIDCSTDGGETWQTISLPAYATGDDRTPIETTLATINNGDKLLIKKNQNNTSAGFNRDTATYRTISASGNFNACGNIMSLVRRKDTQDDFSTAGSYQFYELFNNCDKIISAENLILPATTLADYCYSNMFKGCTSLTTTPELPATTLANSCYRGMFANCSLLASAPSELPATTLANNCYYNMFNNCTSLTTAPELPATTLANECYRGMFDGCTSLTDIPDILPATTLATSCYRSMFGNCTSLTKVLELPATTLADECYYYMFGGTSITEAPELSATTLAVRCYRNMFRLCESLTTAPELPATTLTDECYRDMFFGCTSLVEAPELPAVTLANYCYHSMFSGCTSLTTVPELQAATLVDYCYNGMFDGCRNLNYIKCLATDISATHCTDNWVRGVASSGTFVKSSNMDDWGNCGAYKIPCNWVVIDDTHVEVTGVTISESTATVDKGDTYTLTASVLPSNATDKVVTWSTSDSNIATVSDGVITGVGCGDATIIVTTHDGGYTATCVVSVENHVTAVDLNMYVATLNTGGTYQLVKTITPSDACDTSVTWTSSDSAIASVNSTGLVSGVTTGSATVTVTTVDGGFSKSCAFTVNEGQHATGVSLSDASITVGTGGTYALTATVEPNDAINKNVTWSSSDSNIASVDSNGVVSGISSGSATITVTTIDGGFTAQCSVSVTASPYTELEYIESTSGGGQYIDLDIKLYETLNTWYDIAIKYNVSGKGKDNVQPTLFGCQKNVSPYPGTFIRMNRGDSTNTIGRYIGGTSKDNTLGNNNTGIELPVQTAPNRNVTNLNNSNQTHSWGTSLFCAFSDENNTPSRFIAAKLYYFKLFSKTSGTSQGTLIRDMMPCKRNSDNAIGLLDKVNNVFYTNPSGDAFVAGPVVNS